MLEPREITDALEERKQAQRAVDEWGSLRPGYQDWHSEIADIYNIYAGNWDVVWPDHVRSRALPKIANFIQLAAEDRSRQVAAAKPSLLVRPQKPGDKAKVLAEKRERIYKAWWKMNRVSSQTSRWAYDAMAGGLTACKTWMSGLDGPVEDRFPTFTRLNPAFCYPDPIFTDGPFVDSMIYSYREKVRTIEERYEVKLDAMMRGIENPAEIDMVEFYDDDWVVICAVATHGTGTKKHEILLAEKHGFEKTPVTIGTRPTMDGVYRGEFFGALGILNYYNKLMTLSLDDAVNKVYPAKLSYDVENVEEYGPDANLEAMSKDARFEYISAPNAPFTNLQFMRDLANMARAAVMLPPSRSGDPNESIISAAGISASNSQFVEDVASLQRDVLAPMLEAAYEVAGRADEKYGNTSKLIFGESKDSAYQESYLPERDIGGQYRVEVSYGPGAALDPINRNVIVLQQKGAGLLSDASAMEQSPFTEDPQREGKQIALETMDKAMFAGLIQSAQQGTLTAQQLAQIRAAVEKDEVTLHDAIAQFAVQAPLASPPGTTPGASPGAPGIAGAAEGVPAQQPQPSLPPLASLMGG